MKNLLGLKSSYARSNLKKIKKTWNLSFIPIAAFKKTYSGVFMQFFFSLNLIGHNLILNQASFSLKLDFEKIKFQNGGTDLYSFKIGTYCQIFLKIGVKG